MREREPFPSEEEKRSPGFLTWLARVYGRAKERSYEVLGIREKDVEKAHDIARLVDGMLSEIKPNFPDRTPDELVKILSDGVTPLYDFYRKWEKKLENFHPSSRKEFNRELEKLVSELVDLDFSDDRVKKIRYLGAVPKKFRDIFDDCQSILSDLMLPVAERAGLGKKEAMRGIRAELEIALKHRGLLALDEVGLIRYDDKDPERRPLPKKNIESELVKYPF